MLSSTITAGIALLASAVSAIPAPAGSSLVARQATLPDECSDYCSVSAGCVCIRRPTNCTLHLLSSPLLSSSPLSVHLPTPNQHQRQKQSHHTYTNPTQASQPTSPNPTKPAAPSSPPSPTSPPTTSSRGTPSWAKNASGSAPTSPSASTSPATCTRAPSRRATSGPRRKAPSP